MLCQLLCGYGSRLFNNKTTESIENPTIIHNKLKLILPFLMSKKLILIKRYSSFKQWLDLQGFLRIDK